MLDNTKPAQPLTLEQQIEEARKALETAQGSVWASSNESEFASMLKDEDVKWLKEAHKKLVGLLEQAVTTAEKTLSLVPKDQKSSAKLKLEYAQEALKHAQWDQQSPNLRSFHDYETLAPFSKNLRAFYAETYDAQHKAEEQKLPELAQNAINFRKDAESIALEIGLKMRSNEFKSGEAQQAVNHAQNTLGTIRDQLKKLTQPTPTLNFSAIEVLEQQAKRMPGQNDPNTPRSPLLAQQAASASSPSLEERASTPTKTTETESQPAEPPKPSGRKM